MKLRVKLHRQSQVIDFEEREPSEVTLGDLKSAVATKFGLENHEFDLSLNKTDVLSAVDQTLSSQGIVSGDLLHIIGTDLPQPQISPSRNGPQRPQPLGSYSASDTITEPTQQSSDVSMATVESSILDTQQERTDKAMDNHDAGQHSHDVADDTDAQVNRFLLEPLVVREATATQVPALLEQLYLSASCGCAADAVWVVLHTLMMEAGFSPKEVAEMTQVPPSWKQSGFYRCSYSFSIPGQDPAQCCVVGVPVASSLIVHGLTSSENSFKTEQLQLKPSDFVAGLSPNVPQVYVSLDRLSRQFKDTVCLPLQQELATAAGLPGGQGFTSLPYEIKIRILSQLDAATLCHLAQTRADLCSLAREKAVWRRLYIRNFGKPENSALTRDWYELYKEEHIQRRDDERRRRQFRHDQAERLFGFPGAFRPYPSPGRFPPHMIGGDYDLNPEFAAGGIPNPMGLGPGRRPGPILPNMGIPGPLDGDPLGGGLGMMPGRPSRRGNLTGSPFGGGGRGCMFRSPFM